ncbi:MAG: type II toxin-antitoxin system VapC family toxin [Micrococcales bacterium]|nr:type II toxin-antitoxin system VapC family toxin [Micrococcales bacterium]
MAYVVDTSALVKLFVAEEESAALRRWVMSHRGTSLVASALVLTELPRALATHHRDLRTVSSQVVESLVLIDVSRPILVAAGELEGDLLRSLDAIHLATALSLGSDADGIVTYDHRLADAARSHGLPVISPGQ